MATANRVRVACLGPQFTFSHEAAAWLYPEGELVFLPSFSEVFHAVKDGQADYGVLPIENSSTGAISDTYEFLLNQPYERDGTNVKVKIVGELILPVQHNLLSKRQIEIAEIETLYTHAQPQLQCDAFLNRMQLQAKVVNTSSTAEAGRRALEDENGACLGSQILAREEPLVMIRADVQDLYRNATRFFAISATHLPALRRKTTFSMVILDQAGMLVSALQMIANQGLNVRNIKTLPIHDTSVLSPNFKDWFVLDVDGSDEGPAFKGLLREVAANNHRVFLGFKVLGSYPAFGEGETNTLGEEVTVVGDPDEHPHDLTDLIARGESASVEFKSTLRFDLRQGRPNKEMAKAVAKAVASFMNSEGGTLFIGVSDDGESLGLEPDLNAQQRSDLDGFKSAFFQCIIDYIGVEFCRHAEALFVSYDEKVICTVRVTPAQKPAWVSEGGKETLFIRAGNSSRPLEGKKALDYVLEHYQGG